MRFGRVNPLLASLVMLAAGFDLGVRANADADMLVSVFVAVLLLGVVVVGEVSHYRRRRAVDSGGEDDTPRQE
jgi:hypothetical protein